MTAANPKFGIVLVIATPLLLVFAYYCAWQAGLRFDSKQGIGDFGSATPWSVAALAAIVLSWLSASLAAPLLAGPTLWRTVGSLLFFGIILLPLGVLVLLSAESAGVQAGGP